MIGKIVICLGIGYLLGCFSTGYFVGKYNHVDIRNYGSGNSGTTNALRTLGKKAGIITLIGDMAKAIIAVLLIRYVIFPGLEITKLLTLYSGLGVVLGHNFPFWMGFKGGKGIAATGGVMISFDYRIFPLIAAVFFGVVGISKYVSLGSLLVSIVLPVWIAFKYPGDIHMLFVGMAFTAFAFLQHRSNIGRLMNGTENKIGQRVKIDKNEVHKD